MRGVRPAGQAREHTVERALHRAAADQRADGDDAHLRRLRARRGSPGTARIGWIETYGLLGATTIASARVERLEDAGGRRARRPRPRRRARRPRPRAVARRTTPGTGTCPAGVTTSVRSAVVRRGQEPRREARRATSRAVTAESGSPRRSACVRTRWSPRSRSPSRNQPSPPHSRSRLERAPASRRRAPSRAPRRSGRRARRGRSRGRARRGGRAPRRRRRRCRSPSARRASRTSCSPRASFAPPTPPERQTTFTVRWRPAAPRVRDPARAPSALEVGAACRRRRRGSGASSSSKSRPSAAACARNGAALPGP